LLGHTAEASAAFVKAKELGV